MAGRARAARGYALVTAYYGDIDPDFDDGFQNGVQPLFYHAGPNAARGGRVGLDRGLGVGPLAGPRRTRNRSRDRRASGCAHGPFAARQDGTLGRSHRPSVCDRDLERIRLRRGRALPARISARRCCGSTPASPTGSAPTFSQYNGHEDRLPVDQHELIALIAPRPVLICSAAEDLWADPKGEFLAALGASPGVQAAGHRRTGATAMPAPAPGQLIMSTIGYHIRPGKHDVTADDWNAFMNFADHHFHRAK